VLQLFRVIGFINACNVYRDKAQKARGLIGLIVSRGKTVVTMSWRKENGRGKGCMAVERMEDCTSGGIFCKHQRG
jgi:hypothetical protein